MVLTVNAIMESNYIWFNDDLFFQHFYYLMTVVREFNWDAIFSRFLAVSVENVMWISVARENKLKMRYQKAIWTD